MADKRLSELTNRAAPALTDELYLVAAGADYRATLGALLGATAAVPDVSRTLGEAAAADDLLYCGADGLWYKAKADAAATLPGLAIATEAGETAEEVLCRSTGEYAIQGTSPTWTPGALVYASAATAGALTQTAPTTPGEYVQVVGLATGAASLWLSPGLVATVVPSP